MNYEPVPGAKQVEGVWLPDTETHLQEMMTVTKRVIVDGKGTYQYHKLAMAMKHVPEDRRRVALDIGAHCGLWSMHLAQLFSNLHAFEPVPLHRELFTRNVGQPPHVMLWDTALGEVAETVQMEVPVETTGNSHIALGHRHQGARGVGVKNPEKCFLVDNVKVVPLDSFNFFDVDLIKIDVEGYELRVVKGARETLLREKPILVLEQKGNDKEYGDGKDAALEYCLDLGMKVLDVFSGDYVLGWQ